jgi:Fe-S-cluster containining protein
MNSLDDGDDPDPRRFRAALQALYRELDAEVAARGPVCALSGRCCRFVEYDHTLFVSEPEVALLLADAPPPARPLDEGATCPWQDAAGRCTAREARPLGCRVYFCDPAYQEHAPALSETFLNRLKRICEAQDLPWNYAPLHHHLRRARAQGRLPEPSGTDPC